jgi:type II secretory pathway pseudopilin PulG
MRRTTSRRFPGPSRFATDEDGFALIEVIVSAVLVIVLATATLSIIERAAGSASGNRQRTTAVTLAQADQDSMRQSPIDVLSNLHTSVDKPVGKTTYTVKSDAIWLRDAGGVVSCTANSARAEYVKITSQVTWPGHPKPVVLESYMSPGVAGVQKGALTVKLRADVGTGTGGIPVSVTGGGSGTTDTNGCVVIPNLAPGANDVGWTASGYVDRNGNQDVTESVSIATGQTAQLERLYDRAASATVNFVDESNAGVRWSSASVIHSGITFPTTSTRTFSGNPVGFAKTEVTDALFPFVAPYSVYAGNCTGNAPTTWLSTATMPTMTPPAGTTTTTVNVKAPTVAVFVSSTGTSTGTAVQNAVISVKPAAPVATYPLMAGCTEKVPRATGVGNGQIKTGDSTTTYPGAVLLNLPYGQWQVCADTGGTGATGGSAIINNTPAGSSAAPGAVSPSSSIPAATLTSKGLSGTMPSVVVKVPTSGYAGASACS